MPINKDLNRQESRMQFGDNKTEEKPAKFKTKIGINASGEIIRGDDIEEDIDNDIDDDFVIDDIPYFEPTFKTFNEDSEDPLNH